MEVEGEGGGGVENERAERGRAEGRVVVRAAQCRFWTERVGLGLRCEYSPGILLDRNPRARGCGCSGARWIVSPEKLMPKLDSFNDRLEQMRLSYRTKKQYNRILGQVGRKDPVKWLKQHNSTIEKWFEQNVL